MEPLPSPQQQDADSDLQTLRLVLPVFAAMFGAARDGLPDTSTLFKNELEDVESDVIEWDSTMRNNEITDSVTLGIPKLLVALNSRLEIAGFDRYSRQPIYKSCSALAEDVKPPLCAEPTEIRQHYLGELGNPPLLLFPDEIKLGRLRKKFTIPFQQARKELERSRTLAVTSPACPSPIDIACNLLQKQLVLKCNRSLHLSDREKVSFSLTRHCPVSPHLSAKELDEQLSSESTAFGFALPNHKVSKRWKVVNLVVDLANPAGKTRHDAQVIHQDICYYMDNFDGFQMNLVANEGKLYFLRPKLRDGAISEYKDMTSLRQILNGEGSCGLDMSSYPVREKLILCYVLAKSMPLFYPNFTFQISWDSADIHFANCHIDSDVGLKLPHIIINLQKEVFTPIEPKQDHTHPAMLFLGVVMLEIVTGKVIPKNGDGPPWKRCNKLGVLAMELLRTWKNRHGTGDNDPVVTAIADSIGSCLRTEGDIDIPSAVRQYIRQKIIRPLASVLEHRQVSHENLAQAEIPGCHETDETEAQTPPSAAPTENNRRGRKRKRDRAEDLLESVCL